MPQYKIQPVIDIDGETIYSVIDLFDVSGNNEVAVFSAKSEASKYIYIASQMENCLDTEYPPAISLLHDPDDWIAADRHHIVNRILSIFRDSPREPS
jgi:hypothetical protein